MTSPGSFFTSVQEPAKPQNPGTHQPYSRFMPTLGYCAGVPLSCWPPITACAGAAVITRIATTARDSRIADIDVRFMFPSSVSVTARALRTRAGR